MTDSQILRTLAALNPVGGELDYDADAERGLVTLLQTIRAEASTPAGSRSIARKRLARLPRWGAPISVAAAVAVAVVVAVGGAGGQHALGGRAAVPPAAVHVDVHGLVADRMLAALSVADDYIVRGDEVQSTAGVVYRSITSTDERSAVNFANVEYSTGGAPSVHETDFAVGAGVVILKFNDQTHQYVETRVTMLQYAQQSGFSSVADLEKSSLPTSEVIRRDLLRGSDRLLGHARLHGRSVLVLANNEPTIDRRIWVDPRTYLPVRMTEHPGRGTSVVINYAWIRRTKQSVAATFAPHVPAGYTKVSHLSGS